MMVDKAAIANPKTHYGSCKHATKHFITQRHNRGTQHCCCCCFSSGSW